MTLTGTYRFADAADAAAVETWLEENLAATAATTADGDNWRVDFSSAIADEQARIDILTYVVARPSFIDGNSQAAG